LSSIPALAHNKAVAKGERVNDSLKNEEFRCLAAFWNDMLLVAV
jgi:hypothetical protein